MGRFFTGSYDPNYSGKADWIYSGGTLTEEEAAECDRQEAEHKAAIEAAEAALPGRVLAAVAAAAKAATTAGLRIDVMPHDDRNFPDCDLFDGARRVACAIDVRDVPEMIAGTGEED